MRFFYACYLHFHYFDNLILYLLFSCLLKQIRVTFAAHLNDYDLFFIINIIIDVTNNKSQEILIRREAAHLGDMCFVR